MSNKFDILGLSEAEIEKQMGLFKIIHDKMEQHDVPYSIRVGTYVALVGKTIENNADDPRADLDNVIEALTILRGTIPRVS